VFEQMKHLKNKIKKLKHEIFDYEEVPEEGEASVEVDETPEEEQIDIEPEEPPPTRRRVSRADYLNYRRFGF
jgi:hypothetical protein